jgi:hypothetical protein
VIAALHDRGTERTCAAVLLRHPALLDDPAVDDALVASEFLDVHSARAVRWIRNARAAGRPISHAAFMADIEREDEHKSHPELDALATVATGHMNDAATVARMLGTVSRCAERRRRELESAANEDAADIPPPSDEDAPPDDVPPPRKPYHRAPNLTRAILERARLPWVALRLDENSEEIARARVGAYLVLVAPEGSGKSSLVLQIGTTWARTGGVFVYFTVELDEEEAAGRVVGQCADESWEMVLRGCVAEEAMAGALDLPRFVVMSGEDARLDNIKRTVEDLRAEFPELPIVVGVDYLQAIDEGNEREERQRVSKVSKRLRKIAKELGVVIIGVSQTSRGNREKLRSGEAVGADTTAMGAESSQLERDAYVTLALGGFEDLPDGTRKMDLSVGKTRMGVGDKAYPVIYDGRSGRFTLAGAARSGSEVRAARASKDDETKVRAAMLAIPAALAQAPEPMFTEGLAKEIVARKSDVTEALKRLRTEPESSVVKVRWQPPPAPGVKTRKLNGNWPHWDRQRAAESGVEIFPAGFGGGS